MWDMEKFGFRAPQGGLEAVQPLGEWTCLYRVDPRGPSIMSIRLVPTSEARGFEARNERDYLEGRAVRPLPPPLPTTAGVLRHISPAAALAAFRREVAKPQSSLRPMASMVGMIWNEDWISLLARLDESSKPSQDERTRRLLRVAVRYVLACQAGDRSPVLAVAEQLGVPATQIRDDLHRARVAGLLEPAAGRGQTGGGLTAKAREYIDKEGEP